MDKFLEKYILPNLNEEEAGSLNRLKTAGEIEAVIQRHLAYNSPRLDGLQENFTKHLCRR